MPIVPSYGQPKVSQAPTPNVQVQPAAQAANFGLDQETQQARGQAQAALGDSLGILAQEQKKADELSVLDAVTQTQSRLTDLVYNPQVGLVARKGKDSIEGSKDIAKEFQSIVEAVSGGLKNARQQEAYNRHANAMFLNLQRDSAVHVAREMARYDEDTTEAALISSANNAEAHYLDPEQIAFSQMQTRAIINDAARRQGKPEAWRIAKLAQAEADMNTRIVNRMLKSGDAITAAEFYQANKDSFGNRAGDIEEDLRRGLKAGAERELRQTAQDLVDGADIQTPDQLDKFSRRIKDVDLRDEFIKRGKDRLRIKEDIQKEDYKQTLTRTWSAIDQWAKDPRSVGQTESPLDFIPPGDYAKLDEDQLGKLRKFISDRQKGKPIETNWTTYNDLRHLAAGSDEEKRKFLQTSLPEKFGELAPSEREKLIDLQANMGGRNLDAANEANRGYIGTSERLNNSLRLAGIDPTPKEDDTGKVKEIAKLRADVEQAMIQKAKESKVKLNELTREQEQEVIDEFLEPVILKRSSFGADWLSGDISKRAFQLTPEEHVEYMKTQVPDEERAKIAAALVRADKEVTSQEILHLYRMKQRTNPEMQAGPINVPK